MLERIKEAIDIIGSKTIISNNEKRVADLGLQVGEDGNFQGFVSIFFKKNIHLTLYLF